MKLLNIEFELKWNNNIELNNLRKYILDNISNRGQVLRWSINNIEISNIENNETVLTINAVVIN
mgnify:FL=1|tara:strand:- start:1012 stop:1203 length:192 start_codon:yes stop_codon:yes gene_type:complete